MKYLVINHYHDSFVGLFETQEKAEAAITEDMEDSYSGRDESDYEIHEVSKTYTLSEKPGLKYNWEVKK